MDTALRPRPEQRIHGILDFWEFTLTQNGIERPHEPAGLVGSLRGHQVEHPITKGGGDDVFGRLELDPTLSFRLNAPQFIRCEGEVAVAVADRIAATVVRRGLPWNREFNGAVIALRHLVGRTVRLQRRPGTDLKHITVNAGGLAVQPLVSRRRKAGLEGSQAV